MSSASEQVPSGASARPRRRSVAMQVVGAAAIAMLLVSCGGGSDSDASGSDPGSEAASDAGGTSGDSGSDDGGMGDGGDDADACSLLSNEEASELSGVTISDAVPGDSGTMTSCTWSEGGGTQPAITLYVYPASTPSPFPNDTIPEIGEGSGISSVGASYTGDDHMYQVSAAIVDGEVIVDDEARIAAHSAALQKVLENAGET